MHIVILLIVQTSSARQLEQEQLNACVLVIPDVRLTNYACTLVFFAVRAASRNLVGLL